MATTPDAYGGARGAVQAVGGRGAAWVRHAAVLVVLALFAVAGWSRRWNGDDAFIVFRVVDNVLSGDGAVYNVG